MFYVCYDSTFLKGGKYWPLHQDVSLPSQRKVTLEMKSALFLELIIKELKN